MRMRRVSDLTTEHEASRGRAGRRTFKGNIPVNGDQPTLPAMDAISECYRTAGRKVSSFYDKALSEAALAVAQNSILAEVERRVDERPTIKKTGGSPRHGSIDAWEEPSSAGTRETRHLAARIRR